MRKLLMVLATLVLLVVACEKEYSSYEDTPIESKEDTLGYIYVKPKPVPLTKEEEVALLMQTMEFRHILFDTTWYSGNIYIKFQYHVEAYKQLMQIYVTTSKGLLKIPQVHYNNNDYTHFGSVPDSVQIISLRYFVVGGLMGEYAIDTQE